MLLVLFLFHQRSLQVTDLFYLIRVQDVQMPTPIVTLYMAVKELSNVGNELVCLVSITDGIPLVMLLCHS